jgi:uncharacterized membrane protein YbhN (UPF0104 family)
MLRSKIKSGGWFLAKAAISIAFLFYATRKIDLTSFSADMRGLNPSWLLLGLGQFMLIPVLGGARWRLVLSVLGSSISAVSSIRLFWIGMILSQVLPSTSGGDATRIVLLWRGGVPFARSVHSVILERLAMLFTLITLVAVMQLVRGDRMNIPGASWFSPLLLCVAAAGMLAVTFGDSLVARLQGWKPLRMLFELSSDARKAFVSLPSARLAGLCLLTHVNIAIGCLCLGKALGLHLSPFDYIFYISLVTLITSLPLSIGGWGIREEAVVALFGHAGVLAHSALAFSVLFGLSVGAISLLGLPFLSLKRALQSARDAESNTRHGAERKLTCPN